MRNIRIVTDRRKTRLVPSVDKLEVKTLLSGGWGTPDTITIDSLPPVTAQVGQTTPSRLLSATTSGGSQLMAQVYWGDGSTSNVTGTLTHGSTTSWNWWNPSPSSFDIMGSHSYEHAGQYTAHIYLWDGDHTQKQVDVQIDAVDFSLEEMQSVGTAQNVVGAPFAFTETLVTKNPLDSILKVTWTITSSDGTSPGSISEQKIDATGFHNTYARITNTIVADPMGKQANLNGLYWDEKPGLHTVIADVEWISGDAKVHESTNYTSVYVTAPTANVIVKTGTTHLIPYGDPSNPSYFLGTMAYGEGPGFSMDVDVDPAGTSYGDKFGVVQTVKMDNTDTFSYSDGTDIERRYASDLVGGVIYSPGYMLDNTQPNHTADGKFTPYYGSFGVPSKTTWDVGETLHIDDSPDVGDFVPPIGNCTQTISINDQFVDTVMYTPHDGITVPIGSLTWEWEAHASISSGGAATLLWSYGPLVTSDYSSKSPTFPIWDQVAVNWLDKYTDREV